MRGTTVTTVWFVLLAGVCAKPVSEKDCDQKGKYYEVDCAEQLQFMKPDAVCFMNDNGNFMVMSRDKSKEMTSTAATSQDMWTENPLNGNIEHVPADVNNNTVEVEIENSEAQAGEEPEAEEETESKPEGSPKEDNSGAILFGILAIAILAG